MRIVLISIICTLFAACGGGGDNEPTSAADRDLVPVQGGMHK